MKNKFIVFLTFSILVSLFVGCTASDNTKKEVDTTPKVDTTGELPELSVYHLTSTWENQEGEKVQLKKYRGKVVVAVMIYTSCTSSCPILVEKVRGIHDQLSTKENANIKYVFISIDPKDDTPQKLKVFAKKKGMDNPQYVFLRSSLDNTRTLAAVLGVRFKEVAKMNYKHSNIISVLDQNGVVKHQQKGLSIDGSSVVKEIKSVL